MKNTITDLNNHLFAELERLSEEDLTGDRLNTEITRAHAISDIADGIINNAKLALDVTKLQVEFGRGTNIKMPVMLEDKSEK